MDLTPSGRQSLLHLACALVGPINLHGDFFCARKVQSVDRSTKEKNHAWRPWLRQELCRRKGSLRQNIGKKGIPGQTDGGGRVKRKTDQIK
jgi:hypothetical protein